MYIGLARYDQTLFVTQSIYDLLDREAYFGKFQCASNIF